MVSETYFSVGFVPFQSFVVNQIKPACNWESDSGATRLQSVKSS